MFRGGGGKRFEKVVIGDFVNVDVHVDAVEEWAGEFFLIILDLDFGAFTFVGGVAEIAAWAGIHGRDEHKIGGKSGFLVGARDGNSAIFEGLAEGLKDGAGEFGYFIEKENSFVGERDLAWGGVFAAAEN